MFNKYLKKVIYKKMFIRIKDWNFRIMFGKETEFLLNVRIY